jgi:tripartite-type tricarboxylate transporter receptor subunit TctC
VGDALIERLLVYLLLLAAGIVPAAAEEYPIRPIRIITGVGPGGTADIFLRVLGEELNRRWGQPIVVEPRPGGNFVIGGRACAEAPADGYTLCMLSGETLAYNMFIFKTLPYNPEKDFVPITNFFFTTTAVVVNATLSVKTLDELAALAKAKPKTLAYVAPSIPQRVFFEKFNRDRGTDLVGIPFRGGAEAVAGVLSGSTPIAFFGLASFLPHLRDGKMNGLLIDATARSPLVPDIATLAEVGYRDNLTRVYYGLVAPAAVPKSIVHRVRNAIADIMSMPVFRQRNLIDRALEPIANTPEEFSRFLMQDRLISEQVVKEAGLQPQ